jgi:CheY-like chemotaxis protein
MFGRRLTEEPGLIPRVLVLGDAHLDGVEIAHANDGPEALRLAGRESFDAALVDLSLPPIDGWMALAALGAHQRGLRLIAVVADRTDIPRAVALGADICVLAGTTVHARALQPVCRKHHETSSRRPTTSGAPV